MVEEAYHWLKKYNLLIFDEIDSTNDEAKRLIESSVNADFVIWAKTQTKGRGRIGKTWLTGDDNLCLSILLKPGDNYKLSVDLSLVACIAVGEVIEKYVKGQKKITFKWPNDVLIDNKKVSGILLETSTSFSDYSLNALIIGIGININNYPVLENTIYQATSLVNEGIIGLDPSKAIDELMKSFTNWFEIWQKYGIPPIKKRWSENCEAIGKTITVISGNTRTSGIFKDIAEDGSIKIMLASGEICHVTSGEVFYNVGNEEYGYQQT